MWGVRPAAPEERSLDLHRSGENSTEGFCKAQMYFPSCQSQARQPSPSLGVMSSEVGEIRHGGYAGKVFAIPCLRRVLGPYVL